MYRNRDEELMNTFDDFVKAVEHKHNYTEWCDDKGLCWITFWVPGTLTIIETVAATN